ncbi:hypothetical protein H9P43_004371 [Blastocladiella emersonii ATCC 22665]|nr:hypothetical protein H9P43_004371 [Blastocladiella emersonii ATCC 22665]
MTAGNITGLTETYYIWSSESFFTGANVCVHLLTTWHCYQVHKEHGSWAHVGLGLIAFGRFVSHILEAVYMGIPENVLPVYLAQLVIAWACQVAFTVFDVARLQILLAGSRKWLLRTLWFTALCTIGLSFASRVTSLLSITGTRTDLPTRPLNAAYFVADAIQHTLVAAAFVYHLNVLRLTPSAHAQLATMLAAPSSLMIMVTTGFAGSTVWDPQRSSIYFAESFRLRAFSIFMEHLLVMTTPTNKSGKATSSKSSQSKTGAD